MQLVMWFVGLLTGLGAYKVYDLIKENKLHCKWYHWIIGIFWYLMGVFVIGFVGTSFAEGEPRAAGMAILIFGGFFLVVSVLLYRFVLVKRINYLKNEGVSA